MRMKVLAVIGLMVGFFTSGCAAVPEARYVYQDGEFGVIGIPLNTPLGKEHFLEQAHTLMREHFPEGYEIVRAEEVVEGDRLLQTDKKAEIDTEPAFSAASQLIKIGKFASTRSVEQRDMVKILECRIIYKRKAPNGPTGVNGFAAVATLTPDLYLDPNQVMRDHNKMVLADSKKFHGADKSTATAAKPADPATIKTSLAPPPAPSSATSTKE